MGDVDGASAVAWDEWGRTNAADRSAIPPEALVSAAARMDAARFVVGQKVKHHQFGPGKVFRVGSDRVTVYFAESGATKEFLSEHSPLTSVADEGRSVASWSPVDLGPVLAGQVTRAEPTVGLRRSDGLRLLYPGKEHTCIGEMESGKSWFAIGCAAAVLESGGRVLYLHFEEADPLDTVERLRALGVSDDLILSRFCFVGPDMPGDVFAVAALTDPAPDLVVLDGVNEAMSLHAMEIRQEDGAAAFRAKLVKPFTAVGAAVLSLDHVVKDRERRDRGPLGSIHKGNGLTGSLILLENAEPFGRGMRGASHVFVTKDRPGWLRREGRPTKLPGKTYLGTMVIDDTRQWVLQGVDLAFLEPNDPAPAEPVEADNADDETVLATVVGLVEAGEDPVSLRKVRARTKGMGNGRVDDALTRLVLDRRLEESSGSNRARLFGLPSAPVGVPELDHLSTEPETP